MLNNLEKEKNNVVEKMHKFRIENQQLREIACRNEQLQVYNNELK